LPADTASAGMRRSPGCCGCSPGRPWRFLGHLLVTPPFSWVAAVGYALVARYRHLLPGGTPACALERG